MKSRHRKRRGGHGRRQSAEDLIDASAHHGDLTPDVLIVVVGEPPVRPRVLLLSGAPALTTLSRRRRRLALETIDVRQVRHHHVPLIRHHAQCEKAEEQGLDGEAHEGEQVGRMIDAAREVVVRLPDAVEETIDEEREGVMAG